jgi:hypothetical protein
MRRSVPAFLMLPLIVGYGMFQGLWAGRWLPSEEVERAAQRLRALPQRLGDWEGSDEELGSRELERAGIHGYVMRHYTNQITGQVVSVLLVCGRPGPIAVHTPDVCLDGSGYEQLAAEIRRGIGEGTGAAVFWVADFRKKAALAPQTLRVYWSWNAAGEWLAADHPRLQFAPCPVLYKLYVLCDVAGPDLPAADDPALDLLTALLPEAQRVLFPNTLLSSSDRLPGTRRRVLLGRSS